MTVCSFLQPVSIILSGIIADNINSITLPFISITLNPIQIVYFLAGFLAIILTLVLLFRPKVIQLLKEGERLSISAVEQSKQSDLAKNVVSEEEITPTKGDQQELTVES